MYLVNINALRLISSLSTDPQYEVAGYNDPGDEGGGTFVWVPSTGSYSDDGGIVIVATAISNGYFKRLYSGTINVKWFGAKGLGDSSFDDQPFIQKALNY